MWRSSTVTSASLVNMAGISPEATDATENQFANPEMFQSTFTTNLFGPVAVIEAFLPLLRHSVRRADRQRLLHHGIAQRSDRLQLSYYSANLPAIRVRRRR